MSKFHRNILEQYITEYKRCRNSKKRETDMNADVMLLAGHRYKYTHHVVSAPKSTSLSGHVIQFLKFWQFREHPS